MGIVGLVLEYTVGLGLSIILNLIDRILAIFFSSPSSPPPKKYSVPVGEEKKGETRAHRHPAAKDGFFKTPVEGCETLADLWNESVKKYQERPCLGKRDLVKIHTTTVTVDGKNKNWDTFEYGQLYYKTYEEVGKRVSNFANGLAHFTGLKEGGHVGIYERTRPKWIMSAQACWQNSYSVITVYDNLGEEALIYSIKLTEMTAIVCNGDKVGSLVKISNEIPSLKYIIYVDEIKGFDLKSHNEDKNQNIKILSYKSVEELGASKDKIILKKPTKDTTAVIMFTSGSTGLPKGVVISHQSVASITASFNFYLSGVKKGDVLIGYLPLAHIFELAMECCMLSLGGAIGYGSPRTLVNALPHGDLVAVRPTIMGAVPRVYDTIKKLALERFKYGSSIQNWIFQQAYNAKKKALVAGRDTPFWNFLVFKKFKSSLGGRVRLLISGGAPLSPNSQEFFRTCFGPIVQGYGLTETSSASTIQHQDSLAVRNSGGPIVACEVKLIDVPEMGYKSTDKPNPRGEILVRGLNISNGYYKDKKKTDESYLEGGWFSTGDIGELISDGSFKIIDRKKNLVKLAHGEYVAIENLEMIYGNSPFVSPNGICVYGDSYKDDVIGLVIPQKSYCLKWAKENGMGSLSYDELLKSKQFNKVVLDSLAEQAISKKKKSFEFVRAVSLINDEWTPENTLLTAAMKLNRGVIVKTYKDNIDALYASLKKK